MQCKADLLFFRFVDMSKQASKSKEEGAQDTWCSPDVLDYNSFLPLITGFFQSPKYWEDTDY